VLLWTFKNGVVLDGQAERDNIETLKSSRSAVSILMGAFVVPAGSKRGRLSRRSRKCADIHKF
jgi:hypothetical protein